MQADEYIDALAQEGALLVAAARALDPDAEVPSCPGWNGRDLLAHIGYIHRWATAYVAGGLTEMVEGLDEAEILAAAPADDQLADWVAEGHTALVEALRQAPADLACWTIFETSSPRAFWARRQAHETTVHRVDAELTVGLPVTACDPEFASDGLDELLSSFLARRRRPDDRPIATVLLRPSDVARRWRIRLLPERAETTVEDTGETHEAADAEDAGGADQAGGTGNAGDDAAAPDQEPVADVTAPAFSLYLECWNRRAPGGIEVSGDPEPLARLHQRFRVRWG